MTKCPFCESGEIKKRNCKEICSECGPIADCSDPFSLIGI